MTAKHRLYLLLISLSTSLLIVGVATHDLLVAVGACWVMGLILVLQTGPQT